MSILLTGCFAYRNGVINGLLIIKASTIKIIFRIHNDFLIIDFHTIYILCNLLCTPIFFLTTS
ncbi:MAG TPA: hypothetical protein PLL90_11005 [Bacteroidales bacterium]|nr:hypothetical protein [Bacteroidales bacterium]